MTYTDVLQVLALSKAGYVPQLLCCSVDSLIVLDLIRRGNAQALIYDRIFIPHLPSLPIPCLVALDVRCIQVPNVTLPGSYRDDKDTAFIFHTAGITLGTPKLVPCSYTHLDVLLRKAETMCIPKDGARQDVYSWRCAIGHISSLFCKWSISAIDEYEILIFEIFQHFSDVYHMVLALCSLRVQTFHPQSW